MRFLWFTDVGIEFAHAGKVLRRERVHYKRSSGRAMSLLQRLDAVARRSPGYPLFQTSHHSLVIVHILLRYGLNYHFHRLARLSRASLQSVTRSTALFWHLGILTCLRRLLLSVRMNPNQRQIRARLHLNLGMLLLTFPSSLSVPKIKGRIASLAMRLL